MHGIQQAYVVMALKCVSHLMCCYAPINVKLHCPPPGLTKGLVGDFCRFDQKFCPTSGAFDRSKF